LRISKTVLGTTPPIATTSPLIFFIPVSSGSSSGRRRASPNTNMESVLTCPTT